MAPNILHLPNGQHLTVTPVFGGLYFKSNELSGHHAPFPPGWTVVLNSADDEEDEDPHNTPAEHIDSSDPISRSSTPRLLPLAKKHMAHRFKRPTLHNDHLFISSISQPNNNDYKPVSSPTRQIAMMLWATLWWYFHQPEPDVHITNHSSAKTPEAGKPRGQWRININREGVFKSKVILPKLERMGLIATEESAVGADQDERAGEGWQNMFVSRKVFWQLDARIYLFTMAPTSASPFPSGTPYHSRPSSPIRGAAGDDRHHEMPAGTNAMTQALNPQNSPGPFHSASHLPTYYPPPPPQFVMSNGAIHPIRPKPPRQGETFYTRYVPSVGQYISFRVASSSMKPSLHKGPVASAPIVGTVKSSVSDTVLPTIASMNVERCDVDLLHTWMNNPRVSKFWGEDGPQSHQEEFLKTSLRSKHSFPVIGCWDGKPFGYFEIYWVKEDNVAKFIPGEVGNWDRGVHCLVGEEEFRGPHRVKIWLSALVHYCWLADERTQVVMMEPRVDNDKLLKYAQDVGFYKQTELCLPHKQANYLKVRREAWEAPAL